MQPWFVYELGDGVAEVGRGFALHKWWATCSLTWAMQVHEPVEGAVPPRPSPYTPSERQRDSQTRNHGKAFLERSRGKFWRVLE